jgi:hypothetical protein
LGTGGLIEGGSKPRLHWTVKQLQRVAHASLY